MDLFATALIRTLTYIAIWLLFMQSPLCPGTYYVDIQGSDSTGDGSDLRPWRTLAYALSEVAPGKGNTIRLSPGVFEEKAFLKVGDGINITGSGTGLTTIKPDSTLFFVSNDWHFDKFLLTLADSGGKQVLQDFSIDGRSKQLYGGIFVKDRSHVLLKRLRIAHTGFTGIWLWGTRECRITEVQAHDNAMGSLQGASASILLTDGVGLEVDHNDIREAYGQALEVVNGRMYDLRLHDNRFSVNPQGNWQAPDGQIVPNLAVEFYDAELKNCEVYNNYFDNNLSLVMGEKFVVPTGHRTVRVHNNYFDLITRAQGIGHAIELTLHDVEIDHNYIRGGTTAIANWDSADKSYVRQNWMIHHNIFHGIGSPYPSAIIAMYKNGINNAHIFNNTVELTEDATVSFIEVNNGGTANNVRIENNLIINTSTDTPWHPNRFLNVINAGSFTNSVARNNFLFRIPLGNLPGVRYEGNLSGDPLISKAGPRPDPYYQPAPGSPLIDRGIDVNFTYAGNAPEIGALEYQGVALQTVFKNTFITESVNSD